MLIKINGIMNSEEYIALLKSYLLQVIEGEIFQHEEIHAIHCMQQTIFFINKEIAWLQDWSVHSPDRP